jgi:hypothetical protein
MNTGERWFHALEIFFAFAYMSINLEEVCFYQERIDSARDFI